MKEYRKGKIVLIILLSVGILTLSLVNQRFIETPLKCLHKEMLGFGCPLCGLSHAVHYFFRFQYKEAFISNPAVFLFVLYVFAEFMAFVYPNVFLIKIRKISIIVMFSGLIGVYIFRCLSLL